MEDLNMPNLPFDMNGYIKFLLRNHLSNSAPTGKIGAQGFSNARPINVKSIATKAGTPVDDALGMLFNKAKAGGLGGIAEEISAGASKLAPMGMANPNHGRYEYTDGYPKYERHIWWRSF